MDEIARAADMGKGTIYEYFSGKEKLFLELCSYFMDEFKNTCIKKVSLISEPGQRIKEFINLSISSFEEFKDFCLVFLEIWPRIRKRKKESPLILKMRQIYKDYKKTLSSYIKEGITAGVFRKDLKPDRAASVILATLDGLMIRWVTDSKEFPLKGIRNVVLTIISEGIKCEVKK
ncbi:MAG: Fatty acid metabolism regulator protein [Dehalococcoidia bacterium]|nr:Fatty acid metabolism regulator protein [Bacillota bacterium]